MIMFGETGKIKVDDSDSVNFKNEYQRGA